MPIIGNPIYQSAFVTDQFSGNGSTTAFTMSVAPAGVTNVLVAVSGVLQDPSTYGVVGNTLTFTAAPPSGTGNISCRYLGVPASGVTTTAYRTVTEFTATASQTTFTPPSYNVGFINVYLNGVLLGSADYTATNGTTVVLATGASAGNLLTVESFLVSSVLNAIPNTAGSVLSSNIQTSVALTTPTMTTPTMTSPTISSGALTIGTTVLGAGNSSSFKNRIINGAMVITQRGTSSFTAADNLYTLDRWVCAVNPASKFTVIQSSDAPAGFNNSLLVTSSSAYTVGAAEYETIAQRIEGYNIADLGFGTASAKTITISFWVKSSLTGSFGAAITNIGETRCYPFSYTISSANTWEQKSVTIAGDTSGSWATTTSTGINLYISLGTGTNLSGTANAWTGSTKVQPTGSVSVVGTNGATWYITGVQLEVGSTATNFDYRPYTTELQLCQRYYYRIKAAAAQQIIAISGLNYATNGAIVVVPYPVPLRTAPTALEQSGTAGDYRLSNAAGSSVACTAVPDFSSASIAYGIVNTTVASGIVAGYSNYLFGVNTNAYLGWSAEL